ncbi:unnamed protein product [Rotaria sp. Silwood2]|nr:unnamed protein product [Rotaria sp. Silwood2]
MAEALPLETLESKIIGHLVGHYQVDDQVAKSIFDATINLYHRVPTITDLNELNSIDKRMLYRLIYIICDYCDDTRPTKVYFNAMMFIFNNGNADAEYAFNQWLDHETQVQNITKGLKVLIYFLEALREYFKTVNVQSYDNFKDIFKSINNNIRLLDDVIKEKRRTDRMPMINKIKNNFDSFMSEHRITLSDSDNGDNDDNADEGD